MRPMIDAHLDLSWCALSFNRDLTQPVEAIRKSEQGMTDEPPRGKNTLSFPEMRRAKIGVCVATLLSRAGPAQAFKPAFKRTDIDHVVQPHAHSVARGQLAYYQLMEKLGHLRFIRTVRDLDAHWKAWNQPDNSKVPIGIILSMEGADPITEPAEAKEWWDLGLRFVGPAHYGRGQYAYGTGVEGPLSDRGVELLKEFQRLGITMDATHLCDTSFWQALEVFTGPTLASHHNCRALVGGKDNRQLSDDQIKALIQRDAVIGVALDAWMLYPNWKRGETKPEVVGLDAVADHLDHVTQLAGHTRHSAIGSDLDGGFGAEQTPRDLDTITDLHKLEDILAKRGYTAADIDAIFFNNWLRFFRRALPA
jgi:membrane dipeptidase